LARKGIYFNNIYDQTGYGNSSDATLLTNSSLYPSRKGAACFLYGQNSFYSLPKVLKDIGFTTAAMEAIDKKFWNCDVFEKSLGFEYQFYKNDYVMVDKLGWGLSDKSFFSQSLKRIKTFHPPFYAFLKTLSTHGPFDQFSSGDIDNFPLHELDGKILGYYLRAMHYADDAIGGFLVSLSENNMLSNTILLIYGDHRAHITGDLRKKKIGISDNGEDLKIPLIIVVPGRNRGEERDTFGGLVDVAPTLCNIMGIDITDRYFLGRDLGNSRNSFVIFRDGSYISPDGTLDESIVQQMLKVSDTILEKDIIPIMKHSQPRNGNTENAENSHALGVAGRGIPGGQGR
jgi:phosphoglycerol transferase MdoB-like AlkP superfamily enzyme